MKVLHRIRVLAPNLVWAYAISASVVLAADEPAGPSLGPFGVIVSNDLFDPSRGQASTAPEDGTGPVASGEEIKERYLVYGTLVSGDIRQAYLKVAPERQQQPVIRPKRPKTGKGPEDIRTVTMGELVDGFRVVSITNQGVDLEGEGERIHLRVFEGPKDERKATSPVALQTPKPPPEVQAPSTTPTAATPPPVQPPAGEHPETSALPGGSVEPPAKQPTRPRVGRPPPVRHGEAGSDNPQEPEATEVEPSTPASPASPFLELLKRSREQ